MGWISKSKRFVTARSPKPKTRQGPRQKILWTGPESEISTAESDRLTKAGHQVSTVWIGAGEDSPQRLDDAVLKEFDTVVVAGDVALYGEMLHRFDGRCISRHYGELEPLQLGLWNTTALQKFNRNKRAHFASSVDLSLCPGEPPWITTRATFIPAQLGSCPSFTEGGWRLEPEADILVTRPETSSTSAAKRIQALADQYFMGDGFSGAAVELSSTRGLIVGGRAPEIDLQRMRSAPALLNLFSNPNLIPMAVLEMLLVGGPIIYFSGSLNALGLPPGGPGEVRTFKEAHALAASLKSGDTAMADRLIAAQSGARARYESRSGRERFDQEMGALLRGRSDMPDFQSGLGGHLPEVRHATRLAYDILDGLERSSLDNGPTARRLVRTLYNIILQREPDPAGLAFHVGRLRSSRSFERTVADILTSEEARVGRSRNSFLAWLNDPADPAEN